MISSLSELAGEAGAGGTSGARGELCRPFTGTVRDTGLVWGLVSSVSESEPGEARPYSLLSFSSDNCAADTDTEDTSPQTSPVSRTVPVNGLHSSPLAPEVPPAECGPPG